MSLLRRIGLSGCVESTTHRGPSDDDILESVNPLKLSGVECHLQSLLCPERGMWPGCSDSEQLLEEPAEVAEARWMEAWLLR